MIRYTLYCKKLNHVINVNCINTRDLDREIFYFKSNDVTNDLIVLQAYNTNYSFIKDFNKMDYLYHKSIKVDINKFKVVDYQRLIDLYNEMSGYSYIQTRIKDTLGGDYNSLKSHYIESVNNLIKELQLIMTQWDD